MSETRKVRATRRQAGPVTLRPAEVALDAARTEVRRVFGRRPRPDPFTLSYCTHCYSPEEMEAFLRTELDEVPGDQLESVLFSAYWTWGDWPALAYFVPRLFDLYLQDELWDAEAFFYKLLLSARPELLRPSSTGDPLEVLREPMLPAERRAIFRFVRAASDLTMAASDPSCGVERIREAFIFLVALDGPIAPVLRRWRCSPLPLVQARYRLLLAEWALVTDGAATIHQTYLGTHSPVSANTKPLAHLGDPEFLLHFLEFHRADPWPLDPDLQSTLAIARDWAECKIAALESPLARAWREGMGLGP